jgi:catechol 2,3-dioxygenase-like lactoylglutathione lyase family enzyme
MTIPYTTKNCVISVGVSDYDRSVAWYRDVLGFPVSYELKEYGWCELDTPYGFHIGIGQTETVTPGNVTPTFGVSDIDEAIDHLRTHDVKVEDWHEIPGMVRLSTFYDPDGTPWMLAQSLA